MSSAPIVQCQTIHHVPGRPLSKALHGSEDQNQAAIIKWFGWATPDLVPIAIPNGGKRSPREGAKLKRTGLLAGAPDVVVALPRGKTLWLETKTSAGRLSVEQIEVHARLRALDQIVCVVRSIPDVRDALRACGVETKDAASKEEAIA